MVKCLKETFMMFVVLFCSMCRRFGGNAPDMKRCTFLYDVSGHPIIADPGTINVEKRERIGHAEYFNVKKWTRILRRKTTRDVLRYVRANHPKFFKKKTVRGSKCILAECGFDDETHNLVCKSVKCPLVEVLEKFCHLIPEISVRDGPVKRWIEEGKITENC